MFNRLLFIFAGLALVVLMACKQNPENKPAPVTESLLALTIDTFSQFPPEVDGCSCYFANNPADFKNGEYIYMNDFAQTSFMKINGAMVKFTQTEFKKAGADNTTAKYKSGDYALTIQVKTGKASGDETTFASGTITLADKSGRQLTRPFLGECGC
jgi:hypothetical protein